MSAAAMAAEPDTPAEPSASRIASTLPDYPVPYRAPRIDRSPICFGLVKGQVDASVMTSLTTRPTSNPSELATGRRFALNTYPMGVIYSGMSSAADATGDESFADFDAKNSR